MVRLFAWLVLLVLLSGCTADEQTQNEASDGDQGNAAEDTGPARIEVDFTMPQDAIAPGEEIEVQHVARNTGTVDVSWPSGGCDVAWDHAILQDDDPVTHQGPRASCGERVEPARLAPDNETAASFVWNGTLWDGERYSPAPDGTYTLRATFRWAHNDLEQRTSGEATVRVESG